MTWWLPVLLALPVLWLCILLLFAGPARAAWREPVLGFPVLIIESDDWGPGPVNHAQALERVAACLARYRDCTGRPPVMTLGLTLSLPDSTAIAATDLASYHALHLDDPAYAPILAAMQRGIHSGVFAPQLHGMAHYWPVSLMAAARQDGGVRAWLLAGPGQETESLPSPLQSRWTDASVLPSRPLPEAEIRAAVAEEVTLYRQVFGNVPEVVVPPTFVWTSVVEAAWAAQGVATLITPGHCCTGRDAAGQPVCGSVRLHNGQIGQSGLTYLVRDRYFEPALGHQAARGLEALAEKTDQGRPCLLETHRFNFTGPRAEEALVQLDALLDQALARHPDLRFLSAAELGDYYRNQAGLMVTRLGQRLHAWAARMYQLPRFARLARLSGLGFVLQLFSRQVGGALA